MRFRGIVEQAHQHRHTQMGGEQTPLCVDCYKGLTEAVALYSADFMAGFNLPASREFEEWQFFQAQTLRKALAEALQLLFNGTATGMNTNPPSCMGAAGWLWTHCTNRLTAS